MQNSELFWLINIFAIFFWVTLISVTMDIVLHSIKVKLRARLGVIVSGI